MKTQESLPTQTRFIVLMFILLVLTMAFFSLSAAAQCCHPCHTKVGIKAGGNLSYWQFDENALTVKMQPGYEAGLFVRIPLMSHFALQPEASYLSRGLSVSTFDIDQNPDPTTKVTLNAFELAAMGMVRLSKFNVHAGPYGYYVGKVTAENKTGGGSTAFSAAIDKDSFHKVDFGLAAGAGIDLGIFTGGVRWYEGITPVGKPTEVPVVVARTIAMHNPFEHSRNHLVQLYAGLAF